MEKKILLAVDGSQASERAADYIGLMEGAMIRDLSVTIYHVMQPIPPFLRREGQKNPETYRQVATLEKKYTNAANEVLDSVAQRLTRHGMAEGQIQRKAVPRTSDAARDILFEAEQGLYDAVVMGRRGLSKAQELFVGSVTNKIVQHASRLPVWIVGGRVSSTRVLCAVDGSDGSLKAVDHLAFMLSGNPQCTVTLFHVGALLANYCTLDFSQEEAAEIEGELIRGEEVCLDDFYARAQRALSEAGLDPDQVETKSVEGRMGVPGAILDEVRRGDYGTVVVGRRGESRSFFLGHVSDKVVARCNEAAVWVVG